MSGVENVVRNPKTDRANAPILLVSRAGELFAARFVRVDRDGRGVVVEGPFGPDGEDKFRVVPQCCIVRRLA